MAFLRFSRDKSGYETFTLVQQDQRGGDSRPRVLYSFRTPPNIKIGRDPFDAETRRSLEQAYPGVGFNWRQITETKLPPVDAIDWRERRRVMKEAKQAARREEEAEREAAGAPPESAGAQPAQAAPAGESRSARRRRRRRGRGQRPDPASESTGSASEPSEPASEPDPSS